MSVLAIVEGDRFIYRIYKHHDNNPDNLWVNSYEAVATESDDGTNLLQLATKLVDFEKAMHMVAIDFDRFTISTWEADSVPYDPLNFMSIAITGSGAVGETNGMLPLNTCLSVARVATSGRFGHIFYRGALDQAEVDNPAGKLVFQDSEEIQSRIDAALTASSLSENLGIAPEISPHLRMISKDGTQIRQIVGLVAAGVSTLPLDHAWFNRTSP
jgi:hypothetical protein